MTSRIDSREGQTQVSSLQNSVFCRAGSSLPSPTTGFASLEQQSPAETKNALQDDTFSNLPGQRIAFGQVFRDNTTALIRKSTG